MRPVPYKIILPPGIRGRLRLIKLTLDSELVLSEYEVLLRRFQSVNNSSCTYYKIDENGTDDVRFNTTVHWSDSFVNIFPVKRRKKSVTSL